MKEQLLITIQSLIEQKDKDIFQIDIGERLDNIERHHNDLQNLYIIKKIIDELDPNIIQKIIHGGAKYQYLFIQKLLDLSELDRWLNASYDRSNMFHELSEKINNEIDKAFEDMKKM